jgi:hypothetical protein
MCYLQGATYCDVAISIFLDIMSQISLI